MIKHNQLAEPTTPTEGSNCMQLGRQKFAELKVSKIFEQHNNPK